MAKSILENPVKELKLLPQLLPMKLGNALLLQYILHQADRDNLGLLPLGFAVGITSLVISLHSAAMDYVFKSFGHVFKFNEAKVKKIRSIANWVNNFLCLIQVVLVNILFIFCVTYYNSVSYDDEKSKYFVIKRIFMLSFLVSMMTFGCTIIAIGAAVFLYCLHNTLVKAKLVVKKEKVDIRESNLPPPASYVIDIGLANVLLGLYIGIDESLVGDAVLLQDLSLWIGVITMLMTMLDTIVTVSLHIAMRDRRLDDKELKFIKTVHYIRYGMAAVQVIMLMIMLGQGIYIYNMKEHGKMTGSPFKCPDNLLDVGLVLSSFVVILAVFVISVILYLLIN